MLQHYWNLTHQITIFRTIVRGVLPLCRGAVRVFYSTSRLGKVIFHFSEELFHYITFTSHILNGACELRQVAFVAASSRFIIFFFLDTISCNRDSDWCTLCVCRWNDCYTECFLCLSYNTVPKGIGNIRNKREWDFVWSKNYCKI